MKTHVKTTKGNYILNVSVSVLIALIVGVWVPFNSLGILQWWLILPVLLIFQSCYRTGEYLLTGKVITISPNLIEGHEVENKRVFIYYITVAILLSSFMIYMTYFSN